MTSVILGTSMLGRINPPSLACNICPRFLTSPSISCLFMSHCLSIISSWVCFRSSSISVFISFLCFSRGFWSISTVTISLTFSTTPVAPSHSCGGVKWMTVGSAPDFHHRVIFLIAKVVTDSHKFLIRELQVECSVILPNEEHILPLMLFVKLLMSPHCLKHPLQFCEATFKNSNLF